MTTDKLDERTEQVILDFERATSTFRGEAFSDAHIRLHARDALRSRIRELVAEARKEGEAQGAEQVRRMIQLAENFA